jgi:hypothetical protein
MLHLVPALILLILQGPSGADRLPYHGRLPGALEALNARLARTENGVAKPAGRDASLASLLALGAHDPHWSAAIAKLLGADWEAASPDFLAGIELQAQLEREPGVSEYVANVPHPVVTTTCRFRDGPSPR